MTSSPWGVLLVPIREPAPRCDLAWSQEPISGTGMQPAICKVLSCFSVTLACTLVQVIPPHGPAPSPLPPGSMMAGVLPTLQLGLRAGHNLALALCVSSGSVHIPVSSVIPQWTRWLSIAIGVREKA